jgi:uncharacterized protein YraI
MNAGIPFAVVALLGSLGVALPALAQADGPDFFRVVNVAGNDVLNMRTAPSASSRIVGIIPPGSTGVRNLGCQGGLSFAQWERATPAERAAAARQRWCRVDYRGTLGWANGRFLAE